jgi:hypothetical protein
VTENDGTHGNDLLSGSHLIKVTAYKAETALSTGASNTSENSTVELYIGEREKIGQGTFGYRNQNIIFY